MKYLKFTMLTLLCLFLFACASTSTDPADLFPTKNANALFVDGQNLMLKGHYDDASQHFEAFEARYPFSANSEQVLLDLIYTYYQQQDTASALAAADRYVHLYPRSKTVDYAYYMRGLIQFEENHGFFERHFKVDFATRDLTALQGAFNDFNQLVKLFPRSIYTPDARLRMVYLRNLFARHVYEIAKFYYDRNMYVAAADRANEVVRHYQRTPSVPKALAIMVRAYRKLDLDQAADKTYQVLKLNFPNSTSFKSVQ